MLAGAVGFGQAKHGVPDFLGVGDVFELKAFLFSGGLHEHMAVIQEGAQHPANLCCCILHQRNVHLCGGTIEEPALVDINHSLGGYNPRVQVVLNKLLEEKGDGGQVLDGEEDGHNGVAGGGAQQGWGGVAKEPQDGGWRRQGDEGDEENLEDENPVPAQKNHGGLSRATARQIVEVQHIIGTTVGRFLEEGQRSRSSPPRQ